MSTTTVRREDELQRILKEAKNIQEKFRGQIMPTEEGEKFDNLCMEAEAIQSELKRDADLRKIESGAKVVDSPTLPAQTKGSADEIIGYLSLGEAFVNSPEFKRYAAGNFQSSMGQGGGSGSDLVVSFNGGSFLLDSKGGRIQAGGYVPVTRKDLETKAIPVLGAGVIQPTRLSELVRWQERQRLGLRDVLNVSRTDSNAVEYPTMTASTRAAAPVADGNLKPEAAMTLGVATAPVRTMAVWIPVTEQQLADLPQLQNIINVELSWDLGRTEEEQILWGDGLGQNLLGIFPTPNVVAGRTVANDTLLDMARRAITDVQVGELEPNAIVVDPLDWETMVLTKATTNEYIWSIVTQDNVERLWSVPVVVTRAVREPGAFATNERRMLVGDFQRGATLWDRQQAGVSVGWKNDDFIRNLRTIRAEQRLAFGVKRPAAFKFRITQARVP
jgi:HK97 family phage major capsid protein